MTSLFGAGVMLWGSEAELRRAVELLGESGISAHTTGQCVYHEETSPAFGGSLPAVVRRGLRVFASSELGPLRKEVSTMLFAGDYSGPWILSRADLKLMEHAKAGLYVSAHRVVNDRLSIDPLHPRPKLPPRDHVIWPQGRIGARLTVTCGRQASKSMVEIGFELVSQGSTEENVWWIGAEWDRGDPELPSSVRRAIHALGSGPTRVRNVEFALRLEASEDGSVVCLNAPEVQALASLRALTVVHATLSGTPRGFSRARSRDEARESDGFSSQGSRSCLPTS